MRKKESSNDNKYIQFICIYSTNCLYHFVCKSFWCLFLYYFSPASCLCLFFFWIHSCCDRGQTLFALITFRSLFTYFCYLLLVLNSVGFLSHFFSSLVFNIAFPSQYLDYKQDRIIRYIFCLLFSVATWYNFFSENNKVISFILYFGSYWFSGEYFFDDTNATVVENCDIQLPMVILMSSSFACFYVLFDFFWFFFVCWKISYNLESVMFLKLNRTVFFDLVIFETNLRFYSFFPFSFSPFLIFSLFPFFPNAKTIGYLKSVQNLLKTFSRLHMQCHNEMEEKKNSEWIWNFLFSCT